MHRANRALPSASVLADGNHTFSFTAADTAGNVSAPVTISATIDATTPVEAGDIVVSNDDGATPVAIASGSITNDNTPTLSGAAVAGNIVVLSGSTTVLGSVMAGSDGTWTFTTAMLSEGSHPLSVTVTDAAGNVSSTMSATVTH